jgi:hypothetical protein
MWRLWRWAFARLYVRSERKWGQSDAPAWTATCAVGLTITLNLFAAVALMSIIFNLGLASRLVEHKLELPALGALVIYLAYRRYVREGAAENLMQELRQESAAETRRQERMLWYYIIGSMAAIGLLGLVSSLLGRN